MSGATKLTRQEKQELATTIANAFGYEPNNINQIANASAEYFRRVLINLVKGRFKVKCPNWWCKDYLLDLLIFNGRFFVTNTDVGVAPLDGTPYGLNMFSRNPKVEIVNEVLGTFERSLYGENADAVVVYLYDDKNFYGMGDKINKYAYKLANVDCSMDINLLNTRLPWIFNCSDSKQAESAKLIYDKVSKGEPAIFTKVKDVLNPDDIGMEVTALPIDKIYIFDKLIEARRSIISDFLTEVGINSTAFEKKERMLKDEVNGNNAEIEANVSYIKKNLKIGTKNVNRMFPDIKFSIKLEKGDALSGKKERTRQDLHKTSY